MAQIDDPKLAFAFLRPACVLLTRAPSVVAVETLSAQLQDVSDGALQQLQDYVLFPLRLVLKLPRPAGSRDRDALDTAVTEAMAFVLETTCVRSWETLRELLSELCLVLCSPADPGEPAPGASEELRLAVLRCLSALVHAAYGDVVFRLFEAAMLPGLGAAVSLLLALAEREKSREVRAAALRALQALTLQCDCPQDHVDVTGEDGCVLGTALASFLPGITMAMTRVIRGDMRQGHLVTARAIKLWARTVAMVMADSQLQEGAGARAGERPGAGLELGRVGELVVQRTEGWARETQGRLALLLSDIISCCSAHRHWRVRLALAELADLLLVESSASLGGCVGALLEALVGGVNDEEPRVRERCAAALRGVAGRRSQGGEGGRGQAFSDVLSESLHGLATSLPRLMRTSDDQRKIFILNVFLGYLKVLGPGVCAVLSSAVHLRRVSQALLQVLELDVTDVRVVEERRGHAVAMETAGGGEEYYAQRKHFLYFTDERIHSVLVEICRTLGYHGDVHLLTDHFLERYRESCAYRKQAALVLNQLVVGASGGRGGEGWGGPEEGGRGGGEGWGGPEEEQEEEQEQRRPPRSEDLSAVVEAIVEEYISQENWSLLTSLNTSLNTQSDLLTSLQSQSDSDRELQEGLTRLRSISGDAGPVQLRLSAGSGSGSGSGSRGGPALHLVPALPTPTVQQLNSNVWQLCLQLEGIGGFARALGPAFRPLLMTSLYAVLEKAAAEEESALVGRAALGAMRAVAAACGYGSPGEMINANADYLVNDVSLNLQRLDMNPQAPRVLSAMFVHSDPSLLPLLGVLVQDVLLALDLSYERRAPLFCCVLLSLLQALARWFPSERGEPSRTNRTSGTSVRPADQEVLSMRRFLLDYQSQKLLAEGVWTEEEEEEEEEGEEEEEEEEEGEMGPEPPDTHLGGPDVKEQLPAHLTIARDILQRCTHLLSHPSPKLRLQVLDIMELCVCVLSEREDELLPMAHLCWPPLLLRLTSDHPLVLLRAFRVLCTLGQTCGDFLRRRVSVEVLPRLTASLIGQSGVSCRAGPAYTHTLAYRTQHAVLQGLGSLCLRLDLGESDLGSVCEACLPYLSCRQPAKLQEASLGLFRQLTHVDPDAVWLTLNELHCPHPPAPPHHDLRPLALSGQGRPRDEFTDNVLKLLDSEPEPEPEPSTVSSEPEPEPATVSSEPEPEPEPATEAIRRSAGECGR